MHAIMKAVKENNADIGLIFDTDVDRAGAVDSGTRNKQKPSYCPYFRNTYRRASGGDHSNGFHNFKRSEGFYRKQAGRTSSQIPQGL